MMLRRLINISTIQAVFYILIELTFYDTDFQIHIFE